MRNICSCRANCYRRLDVYNNLYSVGAAGCGPYRIKYFNILARFFKFVLDKRTILVYN